MFKTYRNSIKILVRSPIFWATIVLVIVNTIVVGKMGIYTNDKDPNYSLSYEKFLQMIPNFLSNSVMGYAIPAFAVITAMIVMVNDYGMGFFEIEKAGGVKSSAHLFGRLAALVEVNTIVALAASFFSIHFYYFTRHGVKEHGLLECFGISSIRILRSFLFCELPAILVFIMLSLAFGAIFKNGYIASAIGIGFVIVNFLIKFYYGFNFNNFFIKYILTNKVSVYLYFTYYDTDIIKTERIGTLFSHIPTPPSDVFIWIAVMIGISIVLLGITACQTKRRKV